ncbi:PP2C family protein-serine/threonine phosphatase [Nodosilinea sp. PGN35]|uniref:PP2C family protein-serine/threonine phosphatase n=1 Tax=Nodosilinea sp. PGN35 TaxID=3020489 RepID=UPI0023B31C52|nr:PP2C family serine/threonine-protein phosphatase [Nodosilinea sp. TSF1-S3]MDF0367531.1 serine/threonine-protein phosphatase [Nodosilinea sp. TSF1-S3]
MVDRVFSGLSDPGLLRTSNQDDYYIDPEGRFFIVADGMGGHAGGQEASRLATVAIKNFLDQHWQGPIATGQLLEQALHQANADILSDQRRHPERADMGTTVVVLTFRDSDAQPWCAHVGDSRLYRLRGHQLEQLTVDHTWIAKAIRAGEVTPAQSRSHPWRHVLSQCLGRDDLSEIDIQPIEVHSGDRLLLCSDGLTEELSDHLIASHLKSIRACEAAATALINSAKQRGGRDNITVVVVNLSAAADADG